MRTLLLSQGDLVVGPAGHATVTGSSKVRQDLALALGEDYGHDRFHPEWGSVVTRFVGAPITAETEMAVYSEVSRVLGQYISAQRSGMQRDSLNDSRTRYTTADVVQQVQAIKATVRQDTIEVIVSLLTASGESIAIKRTVGL